MTKRIVYLMLAAALCLCAMSLALAEIYPHGEFEYEEDEDGAITITGYAGTASHVQIPARIGGKPVTSIGRGAFEGCENIVSVYLNNVERIGEDAFRGCSRLAGVNLNRVKVIEKGAFLDCTGLAEATVYLYEGSDITLRAFDKATVVALDPETCIESGEGDPFVQLIEDVDVLSVNGVVASSGVGDSGELPAVVLGNAVMGQEIMAKVPWIGVGDLLLTESSLVYGRHDLSKEGQYDFTDGEGGRVSMRVADPSGYMIGSTQTVILTRDGKTIIIPSRIRASDAPGGSNPEVKPEADSSDSPVIH